LTQRLIRRLCAVALVSLLALPLPPVRAVAEEELPPERLSAWRLPEADLYGVDAHRDHVWAVGYWGTVLRSIDGGESFATAPSPTHETLFAVSFADDRHGWAVGANGVVLRSEDGGASWMPQRVVIADEWGEERPLDSHLFDVFAVSPLEAWAVGDYGVVIHVRDGRNWQQRVIPEEAFADDAFPDRILNGVHFTDPQHGWIAGEFGTTLRTLDGGETWVGERELVATAEDLYLFDVVARGDEGSAAAVGLEGSVVVTADGGEIWQPHPAPTSAALFTVAALGDQLVVAGDRGQIFVSFDGGVAWRASERPRLFNWLVGAVYADANHAYVVGEKGLILRSDDGGANFRRVAGAEPPPMAAISEPPRAAPPRAQDGRDATAPETVNPQD
jgi:photosystem II stability/assembly factor-like uncharacterized protein